MINTTEANNLIIKARLILLQSLKVNIKGMVTFKEPIIIIETNEIGEPLIAKGCDQDLVYFDDDTDMNVGNLNTDDLHTIVATVYSTLYLKD